MINWFMRFFPLKLHYSSEKKTSGFFLKLREVAAVQMILIVVCLQVKISIWLQRVYTQWKQFVPIQCL